MVRIRKGLNLPITGSPNLSRETSIDTQRVAVVGVDHVGMKPTMKVKEGDTVIKGQPLFEDKKNEGIVYTAPASGTVEEINRGDKRLFLSVVISVHGSPQKTFTKYSGKDFKDLGREKVKDLLIESGEWVALRTRPFSCTPKPDQVPNSIFITAMDSNPLALNPQTIINKNKRAFEDGVDIISNLTEGKVFICQGVDGQNFSTSNPKVSNQNFKGPHPSGLVGTHIHFLDPVHRNKTVWHIGYQDIIAIGELFHSGHLFTERYVSLGGPMVKDPHVIKTHVGADLSELTSRFLKEGESRIVSGSVLSGRKANKGPLGFLGRYHCQVSVLKEGREREFLGWHMPGFNKFSIRNVFALNFLPKKKIDFTTNTNGSPRGMIPIGMFEDVMPLDIQPTFLLRSLLIKDTEQAQDLGILELDEEDLGLCTFVCPGKSEYGSLLRDLLNQIERDG